MKKWLIGLLVLALVLMVGLWLAPDGCREQPAEKPVLYFYPPEDMELSVELELEGALTHSYPDYGQGWRVLAKPDGTLMDLETGREYYCLFWEGQLEADWDLSRGFVVPGGETRTFLEDTLEKLGLNDKEANEFLIYWLPRMESNPYNLIAFQQEAYEETAKLRITPEPDSVLRICMTWKALDAPVEVEPQELPRFERKGFVVVEWGGVELKEEGI